MTASAADFGRAVRGAQGAAVILSANPIHDTGGGQRSAQIALELLERGWAVAFVSHGVVTETVDLGLRYDQPRLVQCTLAEALRYDARRTLLGALAGRRGLLVTQVPVAEWVGWVQEAGQQGVETVYDCIDRWDSELGRGWYRRGVEADMARVSATLAASAPALVDHVEELTGRPVELLPNAFNGRVFDPGRGGLLRPGAYPDEGRVALYVGALWGGWMDWALVRSAAEALPETTFVFVGDHRSEGRRLPPNCTFVGLVPQTELPPYLAHADVAFVPWGVDHVTAATSPLKVYEFVGMELPVVAPAIEPLRGIPGVAIEASKEAFVRALGNVGRRGLGQQELQRMRAFAADNSWARRVDELLGIAGDGVGAAEGGIAGAGRVPWATESNRRRAWISVVVPAYNHERFIRRALESVQQQTLPAGEVVVVDDGSTDGTSGIVEGLPAPEVRLFGQKNRGAHNALNRAIRLARGDWVAVLNSDDAWGADRLEHAWAVARETGAALVLGSVRLVDEDDAPVDPTHEIARWYREARRWAEEAGTMRAVLARHNIGVTTSNFLFHRSLWRRLGGFRDFRYVHDYDFLLRAMELCPGRVVYEPDLRGVLYRVHAANTITDGGAAQQERADLVRSLSRPVARLRRTVAAWRGRRALVREVQASSVLEPVSAQRQAWSDAGPREATRVRPRVGLVVDSLGLGGLEEVVGVLAQALPTAGVDTAVVCVGQGGEVARRLVDVGVDVTVLHGRVGGLEGWVAEKGIVAANSHYAPVGAVEILAEAGVPVVETVQNCYAWLDDRGWAAERRRADCVAAVIAVSDTVAAYYSRRTGRAAEWTVPNPVHPARAARAPHAFARRTLGLPEDAAVMAFIGRITEQKNPAGLLDAFAGASSVLPEAVLVLAGPADGRARLPALRRKHAGLFRAGRVRHLPAVPHVGTVLSAADVYVSDAFYEGWSVAASEAAWNGRPLLLSETGGSRELVGLAEGQPVFGDAGIAGERGIVGERGVVVPNPCGDPLAVDSSAIRATADERHRANAAALSAAMVDVLGSAAWWRSRQADIRAWARTEVAPGVIAHRYAEILTQIADLKCR